MTYFKLSFLFSTALACTLVACGSDDSGNDSDEDDGSNASNGSNGATNTDGSNSGSGGTGGSGSGGTGGSGSSNDTSGNTTGGDGNACNPTGMDGSGGTPECTELDECVMRECQSEYAECMGPNFASGNFSGGTCEDYLECAGECQSGDDCDTACVLDCLGNVSSACESCLTAVGECGTEACEDEYQACNESQTSTTTAGSTTGGGDGTCMDLEECCNSLDEESQESCLSTLEAVSEGGDQACAILLATYQSGGQC